MLNTGHARGLVSASGSRSPGLFPGLSRFAGPLLQGTATEPFSLHPGARGRHFPEECSWVRYLIDSFALGQFYLKRTQTLSVQGR